VVCARAVEEAEAAHQVRQRGNRQHRDDEQVRDLLGARARTFVPRAEEVVEEPGGQVSQPCGHRDDDGEPSCRDPAVAGRLRDGEQHPAAPVAAPLPALSRARADPPGPGRDRRRGSARLAERRAGGRAFQHDADRLLAVALRGHGSVHMPLPYAFALCGRMPPRTGELAGAARYKIRARPPGYVPSRTREMRGYLSGGIHLSVLAHDLLRPRLAMAE
jgi:hypothetical protein